MRRREFIGMLGSAVVAQPLAARAQPTAMPVIGFMSARSPEDTVQVLEGFYKGLGEGGFVSGGNVNVEYRWARGDYDRLPALAAELVQRHVAVLVGTGGDASARAAKEATATIPVVFNMGSDPVKAGLVQSFNRPGANVTGSVILTEAMEQKRFGILRETVADVALFGAIVNPNYPASADQMRDLERPRRYSVGSFLSPRPAMMPSWAQLLPCYYANGSAHCWSPPIRISTRAAAASSPSPRKIGCPLSTSSANMRSKAA